MLARIGVRVRISSPGLIFLRLSKTALRDAFIPPPYSLPRDVLGSPKEDQYDHQAQEMENLGKEAALLSPTGNSCSLEMCGRRPAPSGFLDLWNKGLGLHLPGFHPLEENQRAGNSLQRPLAGLGTPESTWQLILFLPGTLESGSRRPPPAGPSCAGQRAFDARRSSNRLRGARGGVGSERVASGRPGGSRQVLTWAEEQERQHHGRQRQQRGSHWSLGAAAARSRGHLGGEMQGERLEDGDEPERGAAPGSGAGRGARSSPADLWAPAGARAQGVGTFRRLSPHLPPL